MSALLALLKQKQQDMAAAHRGRTVKIPENSSRWRILGSWRGEGQQFWHDFGQHFIKDASGKMAAVYMCAEKTFGKPCAVCDAVSAGIKSSTDDTTTKLLNDAKSASRILLNVMHLDSAEPHKVQIAEFPPTVFEQIITIAAEWEDAGETIFGPNGKDLVVNRTGAGKQTKYSVMVAAKTTAIPAGMADKLHDLDDYVAQESSEAMNRALNSVRSVAGILPAPAASSGLPAAARGAATLVDEDPYATAAKPPARRATPTPPPEFEDVPDLSEPPFEVEKPAVPPKPAAAAKPAAAKPTVAVAAPTPVASSTGDDDLDALLDSLS